MQNIGHQWVRHKIDRPQLAVLVLFSLLIAAACGGGAAETAREPIRVDAVSVNGERLTFEDLGDQDTLLWFWAPWWPHCKDLAPAVAELQERYSNDIRFIGISGQDDMKAMEEFVHEFNLDRFHHVADGGGSIWRAFQISAQPSFVFINDNGEVRRHVGGLGIEPLTGELDDMVAT